MKNWITKEIFEDEAGHCDYYDWEFESINFYWAQKEGVWHISAYDIHEVFDGTIEGRPLNRCVCNNGQFTHYTIKEGKRVGLLCPICEPTPTQSPPTQLVVVYDEWEHEPNSWWNYYFIHTSKCKKVHHIKRFVNHRQRYVEPHTYPNDWEGVKEIGWGFLVHQMEEREDNYEGDTFLEEKARNDAGREVLGWATCSCVEHLREA
tara:strand:+ start:324 stop:938 length:615 start_codon:yes stop_codon:yes gene_type:complete